MPMPMTRPILCALVLGLAPMVTTAQPIELSQSQMRQLVRDQKVLSAEIVVGDLSHSMGGTVMDIRGFSVEGVMTYRLLMQQRDGTVLEVLVDGTDGQPVGHDTPHGQIVSAVARSPR